MHEAYIGIDVAIAKGKHLPVVVSTLENGRLVPQSLRKLAIVPPRGAGNVATLHPEWPKAFARETKGYIAQVCNRLGLTPVRIGIDAPSAPCGATVQRRAAELALDDAGISCFATPSAIQFERIQKKVKDHLAAGGSEDRIPHSNQLWMLAGFALFTELADLAECLEVFPQATVRMVGAGQIHKSKPGAVLEQLAAVSRHTGWPGGCDGEARIEDVGWGTSHDQLDAYTSSWVASLAESERTALGRVPEDAIWVPKVKAGCWNPAPMRVFTPAPPRSGSRPTRAPAPRAHSAVSDVMCPACESHSFKRWPWGWDAHAAHRCAGLAATEPEARKAEYRQRFSDYF